MARWNEKMPRFFYWLVVIAFGVGCGAFTINTAIHSAGAVPHPWWSDMYPYIIGVSAGIVFACKFTVRGGYKDIDIDSVDFNNFNNKENIQR